MRDDEPKRRQHRAEIGKPKPLQFGIAIYPELLRQLQHDADKFNVSMSFVINTALSVTFGIDVGEKYWSPEGYKKPQRKKNGRVVKFRRSA